MPRDRPVAPAMEPKWRVHGVLPCAPGAVLGEKFVTPMRYIRSLRSRVAVLAWCVCASSSVPAQNTPVPASIEQAGETDITRNVLEAPIRFLASDELEGRGPASRGDQLARLYLATQLEALGFAPGGPGGQWQQAFDIVGIKSNMPAVWSFEGPHGRVELKWRADYIGTSGQQREQVSVDNAELVFVGYGIQARVGGRGCRAASVGSRRPGSRQAGASGPFAQLQTRQIGYPYLRCLHQHAVAGADCQRGRSGAWLGPETRRRGGGVFRAS